eukprot:3173926-Prymnesium_polylepis.4
MSTASSGAQSVGQLPVVDPRQRIHGSHPRLPVLRTTRIDRIRSPPAGASAQVLARARGVAGSPQGTQHALKRLAEWG